ncbi:hypothetical protein GCM10027595_07250 [Corynebacterium nasicanis]
MAGQRSLLAHLLQRRAQTGRVNGPVSAAAGGDEPEEEAVVRVMEIAWLQEAADRVAGRVRPARPHEAAE